jgi:hypothetical protein
MKSKKYKKESLFFLMIFLNKAGMSLLKKSQIAAAPAINPWRISPPIPGAT